MDSVKVSNYYANIFPLKELVDKLDVTGPLCMREISFCLESGGYVRNLSFKDAQQLSDKFASLKPHKIDIGAVYRTKSGFKELSNCIRRELVFDIDASDYDEIRSCCKEKKFCEKCYIIVLLSCKLLHYLMKSTTRHFNVLGSFGFNDIKWFFSGRRGLHCWIFDSRALSLSSSIRKALTNYLSTFYKRHVALSFDRYRLQH